MKRLSGPLRGAGVGIVLLVLVFMPFFKGLFFWTELLPAIGLVALAFALWIVGRRMGGLPVGVPGGVAGGALLALAGCYALQFVWAVYPRGNLDWLLRVLAGWFVFVMFRAEASERLRRVMAWAFVVGATGVAVHGLIDFTGLQTLLPELRESLSLVNLSTRMFTSLQYPNTAAAYFLASYLVALGLTMAQQRSWIAGVVGGFGALMAIAFFFTVSRGAALMVPAGFCILLLGLNAEHRLKALTITGAAVLPSLAVLGPIGEAISNKAATSALTWVGVAVLVAILLSLGSVFILRLPTKRIVAVMGVLVILCGIGLGVAGVGGRLPKAQVTRLLDVSLQTHGVALRMNYYGDALKMILDQPLGRGGWGWARSYRHYATFNYTAQETHNHYAQTAVDAGLPGLLALGGALLASLWPAWRTRKGNPTAWAITAGAMLIAGHSLIDFDLSYGGIWLMLWSLLGVGLSDTSATRREGVKPAIAWAASLAILVTASSLWWSAELTEEAVLLATNDRIAESEAAANRAVAWDRLNSEAMIRAGQHLLLLRAVEVDPSNPEAWFKLAISHEVRREWQMALEAAKRSVALEPWSAQYVDKEVRLVGFMMLDELAAGRQQSAMRLAESLLAVEQSWNERLATASKDQHLWKVRAAKLDPATLLRFGQARFLLGDLEGAHGALVQVSKVGLLNSEAEVWLYALYERQGDAAKMKSLESQPWIRFRDSNPTYRAIRSS